MHTVETSSKPMFKRESLSALILKQVLARHRSHGGFSFERNCVLQIACLCFIAVGGSGGGWN